MPLDFATRDEIRGRIARFPLVRLACLPTPLQPCPRASADLGIELWIKRDGLTRLAFGGNKTRNLEFRMAEAQRSGADVLVFGVEIGSTRRGRPPPPPTRSACRSSSSCAAGRTPVQGTFLIDYLLGAGVRIADLPPDADLDVEVGTDVPFHSTLSSP